MKKTIQIVLRGLPMAIAAVVWLTGCATHKPGSALEKEHAPVYDTAEQIQTLPACKAVVVERGPCYVRLGTAYGSAFFIGSPGAGADVVRFLGVLEDGRTYKFPDTFQKYQEQRRQTGQ